MDVNRLKENHLRVSDLEQQMERHLVVSKFLDQEIYPLLWQKYFASFSFQRDFRHYSVFDGGLLKGKMKGKQFVVHEHLSEGERFFSLPLHGYRIRNGQRKSCYGYLFDEQEQKDWDLYFFYEWDGKQVQQWQLCVLQRQALLRVLANLDIQVADLYAAHQQTKAWRKQGENLVWTIFSKKQHSLLTEAYFLYQGTLRSQLLSLLLAYQQIKEEALFYCSGKERQIQTVELRKEV